MSFKKKGVTWGPTIAKSLQKTFGSTQQGARILRSDSRQFEGADFIFAMCTLKIDSKSTQMGPLK